MNTQQKSQSIANSLWCQLSAQFGVIVVAITCLSGCVDANFDKLAERVGQIADSIDKSNDTAKTLQNEAMRFQKEFGETARETTSELDRIAQRAVAASGTQAKCLVDYTRTAIKRDLSNLAERLKAAQQSRTGFGCRRVSPIQPKLQTVVPYICDLSHASIDFSVCSGLRTTTFEIYGYDLDATNSFGEGITVIRKKKDGSRVNVTSQLFRLSKHFHAVMVITQLAEPIGPQDKSLSFEFEGKPIGSEIPVNDVTKWSAEHRMHTPGEIGFFIPKLIKGDADFGKGGPKVDVRVETRITNNGHEVQARLYMYATEVDRKSGKPVADYTTVQGYDEWRTIYTVGSQEVVTNVTPSTASWQFIDQAGGDIDEHETPMMRFFVRGDGPGDHHAGFWTGVKVRFHPMWFDVKVCK